MDQIANGKRVCFSANLPGCSGAACYLGLKTPNPQAGSFLAKKEKFKNCIEYGEAFYNEIQAVKAKNNYLILSRIQDIPKNTGVEVINLWVNAMSLTELVTLTKIVTDHIEGNAIKLLHITPEHLDTLRILPFYHKDPFDRLIIVQAKSENMTIVSRDKAFDNYGKIQRIWEREK